MIRINLSGAARQKGKRAAAAAPEFGGGGEGPSSIVFVLIGVVLLGILAGLPYWWIGRESARLEAEKLKADQEMARLQTVKTRVEQKQKLADDIRRRTDAIWLATMRDDGSNINLEGVAFSPHAVANLMANLKRTGYFKAVELKETVQDEKVKDMQAFEFTIICEKKPKS